MSALTDIPRLTELPESIAEKFLRVRTTSIGICDPLQIEDYVVQSMPDASPLKWHLAHTSWFFEQFVLIPHLPSYKIFNPQYEYLFNSYYQSVGRMHLRSQRGVLTRPTVAEVMRYRQYVNEQVQRLLLIRNNDDKLIELITLGLNHEQQHQELMLTDIKHAFACNPLLPVYRARERSTSQNKTTSSLQWVPFDGGIKQIGADGASFSFDNELPRHRVLLEPFAIAERLVTNSEYLEFVRAGGYTRAELWLADGWNIINSDHWSRPLYWQESLDSEFTLHGLVALDSQAPVCHLSYYEADAFARWAGVRLPTEFEWEIAANEASVEGNFLDSGFLHPQPCNSKSKLKQLFGDVWEWTASSYAPYPGYCAPIGALGEYNGKFMCNQLVLRGGSCATPADHIRSTYRNFFYPQMRWQFMGMRLAKEL